MGASECRGKPPNALRAKGAEKEEEEEEEEMKSKFVHNYLSEKQNSSIW
jgi:hypothetical protein